MKENISTSGVIHLGMSDQARSWLSISRGALQKNLAKARFIS